MMPERLQEIKITVAELFAEIERLEAKLESETARLVGAIIREQNHCDHKSLHERIVELESGDLFAMQEKRIAELEERCRELSRQYSDMVINYEQGMETTSLQRKRLAELEAEAQRLIEHGEQQAMQATRWRAISQTKDDEIQRLQQVAADKEHEVRTYYKMSQHQTKEIQRLRAALPTIKRDDDGSVWICVKNAALNLTALSPIATKQWLEWAALVEEALKPAEETKD